MSESGTLKALWKDLENVKLGPFSPAFSVELLRLRSRFPVSLDNFRKKHAIQTLPTFEGYPCNLLILLALTGRVEISKS